MRPQLQNKHHRKTVWKEFGVAVFVLTSVLMLARTPLLKKGECAIYRKKVTNY